MWRGRSETVYATHSRSTLKVRQGSPGLIWEGYKGPGYKCEQLCDRKVMEERSVSAEKGRNQRGKLMRVLNVAPRCEEFTSVKMAAIRIETEKPCVIFYT